MKALFLIITVAGTVFLAGCDLLDKVDDINDLTGFVNMQENFVGTWTGDVGSWEFTTDEISYTPNGESSPDITLKDNVLTDNLSGDSYTVVTNDQMTYTFAFNSDRSSFTITMTGIENTFNKQP